MGDNRRVCIAVIVVQYSVFVYGTCSNSFLTDLPLRDPSVQTNHWADDTDTVLSDTSLNYEWYRTIHNGWQYLMTDSDNKPNYTACSTYYPVFLKGKHPPVETLTETPVEAIACKRDYLDPCDIQHEIKIRKCGQEVEYYLPPSKSYSAYCFEKYSRILTPAPDPENVVFGNVTVSPELDFTVTNVPGQPFSYKNYDPYFRIRCNFNKQEELFYKVNWYIDGAFIVSYGPSNNNETLLLHEDDLTNNNITLGFEIHCGVSALASEFGEETEMVYSEKYFAGVKVLNQHVIIQKGESAELQIKSTIPIGCRYNEPPGDDCIGGFQIFNHNDFDCTQAGVVNDGEIHNQRCTRGIQTLKYGSTWDPDSIFNFTIVTTDMNYNDKLNFKLLLQFSNTLGHSIWRKYNFPLVSITVRDKGDYKQKICYSHIDPHMRTADGTYYEQQRKNGALYPGVFMLYRNFEYGIEVQEQTKICNHNRATCACGVAISAGKDVFMINRCGSIRYLGFTRCDDGGILQVVKHHDYLYSVFTPIGTKITISLYKDGTYEGTMNIDITMAPKDLRNIEGLCGYFDNDQSNDFRRRKGSTSTEFTESWSLEEEDVKDLNLFLSDRKRELNSWEEQNAMFCVCNSTEAEAVCYPTQYLECKMDRSITGTKCIVPNRKKRSVLLKNEKEMKRLLALMKASNPDLQETNLMRERRQDEEYTITEEQAKALCTDKINGSLAVNSYGEVNGNEDPDAVINQCIFDVTVGNDTFWASAHLESVNNIVKSMMDKEPSYVQNNTEKVEIFLLNTCPDNCSDNGVCLETGLCDCFGFYHGPDCLIDERDSLVIDDIEGGGVCDLADGIECKCFHVRSSNILEGFRCNTNVSKVTVEGTTTSVSSTSFSGGYEDIFTGVCCVQDDIIGTDDVFIAKYSISISNNGETYGNDKTVYVFDSTCQDAVVSSDGKASFSLKPGNCFIDGYCRAENEMALTGCQACQSATDAYNWTVYNPCENGGNCTGETDGYTCSCVSGYGGKNCEYDIDECGSHPCQNGGTCTDFLNGYSCSCMVGFTGTDCAININECASNPCQNNGICIDSVNEYVCECSPGFNGIHCETEIDECLPGPCQNGGSCSDRINGYICTCAGGYYGVNCSAEINECNDNPCENSGTCEDQVNGRICHCVAGFEGINCEIEINECKNSPCLNGGSCSDLVNGYSCTCKEGFNGSDCELDINECLPYPCKNGGACKDLVNGYECTCIAGYDGDNCENDINECLSEPCKNGATCKDLVNRYECTCIAGYDGDNCENDVNECLPEPCQNGGTCEDGVNEYICKCPDGYNERTCSNDINECLSDPCKNGATCYDLINGYECTCFAGYDGDNCEIDIDECVPNPCKNGATCTDLVNEYECTCIAGYDGDNCENDINECLPEPCRNGGSCEDRENGYICKCPAGFDNINCSNDIDECVPNPCKNGGTCNDLINGYECTCIAGYDGDNCIADIDECIPDPCQNGGTCEDRVNGFTCNCLAGFDGSNCSNDINDCFPDPCHNKGTCYDLINGYECKCEAGYEGGNCGIDVNDCLPEPCQNGGTCKDRVNGHTCKCPNGYDGLNCTNDIDECFHETCKNGGTCTDLINGYKCACVDGYHGDNCGEDKNECLPDPCQNGGTCEDRVNGYTCKCLDGFSGTSCSNDINECIPSPCKNGATCNDLVNGYTCTCMAGYDGDNCENDINECLLDPCKNVATCKDLVNGYECTCIAGYDGDNCENDINECLQHSCLNGGTCEDRVNGYLCKCAVGYDGTSCNNDINECSPNPCLNGGSCVDRVNGYICNCPDGYDGTTCNNDIDECLPHPCENDGICEDHVNGYTCKCTDEYKGVNCQDENILSTTMVPTLGIAQIRIVMVFPIQAKDIDLNDPIVHKDITSTLTIHYRRLMGEKLKEIELFDLRYGSIIVDFKLRYENTTSAVDDLAKSNENLLNGEDTLVLLNETVAAMSVQINDVIITNDTIQDEGTRCKMFEAINGFCQDSHQCSLLDGKPTCIQSEAKKGEVTLVIVVVACSIAVPVIVVLITCLSIREYRIKQKPAKSTTKHAHSSGFEEFGQRRHHPTYKLYGGHMSGPRPSSDSYYPDRESQRSASGFLENEIKGRSHV